jgi:hypothetical protein
MNNNDKEHRWYSDGALCHLCFGCSISACDCAH